MTYPTIEDFETFKFCNKGRSYVRVNVPSGTIFGPGSIPKGITELSMILSAPTFLEGSIPSDLEILSIKDIAPNCVFPPTTKVLVTEYTGANGWSGSSEVYICADEKDKVDIFTEHYIHSYRGYLPKHHLESPAFSHGETFSFRTASYTVSAAKRTPLFTLL